MQVWQRLCSLYKPYNNLRTCEVEKIEYYRAQADMMEDLKRIFDGDQKTSAN